MTVLEVLGILWRRRVLTLVGVVATVAAMMLVASHQAVYWSQANVVFLEPTTPQKPNALTSTSGGLIAMAGYVEQVVNAGTRKPATAANVTLLGRGVRDGSSVELPDNGGQWSHNFEQAVLNVQVTGPSEAAVRGRLDQLIDDIRATSRDLQSQANVTPGSVVRTDVSPSTPSVGSAGGNRLRAVAGTLLLGLGLTVSGVLGVDRLTARLGRARRRTPRTVTA